jgi:hypothetical protein
MTWLFFSVLESAIQPYLELGWVICAYDYRPSVAERIVLLEWRA